MRTAAKLVLSQWVMKGITDACTTCGCCGRQDLKRTVAIVPLDADGNEDGDPSYYGTGCAATALRRTQTWITNTANAATLKHNDQDSWACRVVSVYGPVEYGTVTEKRVAWFSRNPPRFPPRENEPGASEQIDRMLTEARAQLRDSALGPARPHSVSDFRPHVVVMTADRSKVSRVAAIPTEDAEKRAEMHHSAWQHAQTLKGGHVFTVWALDVQSAEEVAYAQVARERYIARRTNVARP